MHGPLVKRYATGLPMWTRLGRLRLVRLCLDRLRLDRRRPIVVAGALLGAIAIAVAIYGPVVRAVVHREASRRHVDVSIGSVRPGWFAVRLLDVSAQPQGMSSIRAHVDEVRVGLGILFQVRRLGAHGVQLALTGSPESLREDWHKWRGDRPQADGSSSRLPIEVDGLYLKWVDPDASTWGADLHGAAVSRDAAGTRLALGDGRIQLGAASVELNDVDASLDADGMFSKARIKALTVGLAPASAPPSSDRNAGPSAPPAAPTPPPVIARAPRPARRGEHPKAAVPEDAGAPLVPMPDLRAARGKAAVLADLLSKRIPLGAELGVDALTWRISQDSQRVALTFGPGPLSVTRTAPGLAADYSTDKRANGTPLALHLLLPTDGSDVVATAQGGPVSLSFLGVKEGAAGLVDVDRGTVVGRIRVDLAGDGSEVTFDANCAAHGLSLSQPRLALETLRGLDVALRARGAMTAGGEVRVDDFGATLGALQVEGSGTLDQKPDHVSAAMRFDVPSTTCQSLLDSVPVALVPVLEGTQIAGTFAAHGRFAFDTRTLDDLELGYTVEDKCRLDHASPELDRDRFTRPFTHRVYLPDGATADEVTGPGSENWTPIDQISPYMQTAVLTTEDGAFPKHHGYNHAAIRASLIANLKARRFVRGASTITMQLAKNLFLSRDKTLSRKIEEIVLTDYLEQTFSKLEILELYLNVIEFGPAVYGIGAASEYYFGRSPSELDLAECLFLSSLLPSPLRYAPMREADQPPDGWMRNLHSLMEIERKRGLITDSELMEAENEQVVFWHGGARPVPRAAVRARSPLSGADNEVGDPFEEGM